MSRRALEDTEEEEMPTLHPKCRERLIAHAAAEQKLLGLFNAKKLPHAIMFTGQKGIGKATLAYRLARFLLSPQETGGGLFGDPPPPESLHIPATHPTFKRMVSGGHPDFLVLEGDDIKIEEARKVHEFLALTPAESNWRVVIIDSAEAMNRNAANALLKILEEPSAQAVILLISHNPGVLLPTIRSRCRMFKMPLLAEAEFADVLADIAPDVNPLDYEKWALLSGGSPGIALELIEGKADTLYNELIDLITAPETLKTHAFSDRFSRKDADPQWKVLKHLVAWLVLRVASSGQNIKMEIVADERQKLQKLYAVKPISFWTDLWEHSNNLFSDTERLYLDRKQAIITLLGMFK